MQNASGFHGRKVRLIACGHFLIRIVNRLTQFSTAHTLPVGLGDVRGGQSGSIGCSKIGQRCVGTRRQSDVLDALVKVAKATSSSSARLWIAFPNSGSSIRPANFRMA